ncbi:hypothetical protein Lser_V15G21415 [Lactuca serriola]
MSLTEALTFGSTTTASRSSANSVMVGLRTSSLLGRPSLALPPVTPLRSSKTPLTSPDGTYAMKKVLIDNNDQVELVKEEIRVSALFSLPNLLPLLYHAIIPVKDPCVISRQVPMPAFEKMERIQDSSLF